MQGDLTLFIKTLPGLEQSLSREIKKLGGRDVVEGKRGVEVTGDLGFVYKANLWLRTALRILVQLKRFQVRDEDHLYKVIKKIPWEDYFDVNKTIAVDATVFSERFRNSLYIAQLTKDAIVDRFRDQTGDRPSVQLREPDVRIDIHIQRHFCTVSLDSSGDSLHKRNYRNEVDVAPLSEVLAAGILSLMEFDGSQNLIDPMCGSGTFLIEGALKASNIPPNVFRDYYAFKNWNNFDAELYDLIFRKSLEKEENTDTQFYGFDIDHGVIAKAQRNTKQALMEEVISIDQADFTDWDKGDQIPDTGILIMNPPYDIKMEANIPELYREIGNTLKRHFSGYTAWILTASQEGIKSIGLRASKKYLLKNGSLDTWLLRYDLYDGSKKVHKQVPESN
ncbi:MAG: putative N6-adenine-specific DNA methylase [Roseivirga sp.]